MSKSIKHKVYFDASVAGKDNFGKNYLDIINTLKDNNCEVTEQLTSVSVTEVRERTRKEKVDMYKKTLKLLRSNDFFVVDMTFGSPSIAMMIQDAIYLYSKPVLMLNHESKEGMPGIPFAGNTSKLLTLSKYSFKSLDKVIKDFLRKVKYKKLSSRSSIRFTEEVNRYLGYKKLQFNSISKNQVLLNMLEDMIDKDELYKKYIEESFDDETPSL